MVIIFHSVCPKLADLERRSGGKPVDPLAEEDFEAEFLHGGRRVRIQDATNLFRSGFAR